MPAFFLPPPAIMPTFVEAVAQSQTYEVAPEFRVEYGRVSQDFSTGDLVFTEGVKLFYGPTVVNCDQLTLDLVDKKGQASGNIVITDPEGRIEARDLAFDWAEDAKTGVAYDALVQVGYLKVQGAEVHVAPGEWTVKDAEFTLEDLERGRTKVSAREVKFWLGQRAKAWHVYFHVLGQKIGPAPYLSINLDRRVTGLKPPSLGMRSGGRIGLEWNTSTLVTDQSAVAIRSAFYPAEKPTYSAYYVFSPLDPEISQGALVPPTDIGERFSEGWFNNIQVRSPEQEQERLRVPQKSYAVGTSVHEKTRGRVVEEDSVSKGFEAIHQVGGEFGDLGFTSVARVQRIQGQDSGPWINRGVVGGTLSLPPLKLGSDLMGVARVDGQTYLSEHNTFGFGRLEVGAVNQELSGFRFGAAYVVGGQYGTPDFEFDRLRTLSGLHFRADYQRGPYIFRYLAKYDLRSSDWFDHEWEVAFAAGAFEPYVQRREFPDEFRVGVRLRLDQFAERLQSRSVSRD